MAIEHPPVEVITIQTSGCCRTTEDGSQVCDVQAHEQDSACDCQSNALSQSISYKPKPQKSSIHWNDIRSGVMFLIACIASPCCTPLIVPLFLSLMAGTPLALWMGQNLGWVYGGLTLLSVMSLVFGLRWLNKNPAHARISLS